MFFSYDLCLFSFSYFMFYVLSFLTITWPREVISYYDLFDFGVLLYGRTPTLILPFFFHHSTTPILTINILIVQANLEENMTRTCCMERRKIVIRRYFSSYFLSIFDPTSLHIPYPIPFLPYVYLEYVHLFYAFMPSRSRTDNKNTI